MNNIEEQFSKMLDDAIINAIQTRIALLDIKERLIEDNKSVTNTIAICIPNELVDILADDINVPSFGGL